MKVEELLKPRYKVIADYPNSEFPVGIIAYKYYAEWVFLNGIVSTIHLPAYPNIFKKLEWWEEREEKDMPEYVKMCVYIKPCTNNTENLELKQNQIVKPDKWGLNCFEISHWVFSAKLSVPATIEDYEQYQQSKL